MARSLILLFAILAMIAASGCQTLDKRLSSAAVTQGEAQAYTSFPDLPDVCVAKVARVYPKVGEKARWTQKRWEITAENRDALADACAAWGVDMKARSAIPLPRPNQ